MDRTVEFKNIILKQGVEAAAKERDRLKEELARRVGELEAEQAALDSWFSGALRDAAKEVGGTIGPEPEPAYAKLSSTDAVLEILRHHGGKMKSTELYRITDKSGKQRNTIYVTVSRLHKEGIVSYENLPGERGCILKLER